MTLYQHAASIREMMIKKLHGKFTFTKRELLNLAERDRDFLIKLPLKIRQFEKSIL